MNKTNVTSIIIGVIILGGLIWIAKPDSKKPDVPLTDGGAGLSNGQSVLVAEEEKNYDFGTISMSKGIIRHSFKIKNTGTGTVTVNKIYTSCMCTTASLIMKDKKLGPYGMPGHGFIPNINQIVSPDEEAIVEVAFDPAAHGPAGVGRIERAIIIENDAGKPLELQFAAVVTP